ncbi:hypothetical protein KIPB_012355, partial [Kipferlia bialata]|eukprot:g12355.t1
MAPRDSEQPRFTDDASGQIECSMVGNGDTDMAPVPDIPSYSIQGEHTTRGNEDDERFGEAGRVRTGVRPGERGVYDGRDLFPEMLAEECVDGHNYMVKVCKREGCSGLFAYHIGKHTVQNEQGRDVVVRYKGQLRICPSCNGGQNKGRNRTLDIKDANVELAVLRQYWAKHHNRVTIREGGPAPAPPEASPTVDPKGVTVQRLSHKFKASISHALKRAIIDALTYLAGSNHGDSPKITKSSWTRLINVLGLSRVRSSRKSNQDHRVAEALRRIADGTYTPPPPRPLTPRQMREDRKRLLKNCSEMIWEGKVASAVRMLDSTTSTAKPTKATLDGLKERHPRRKRLSAEQVEWYTKLCDESARREAIEFELADCTVVQVLEGIHNLSPGASAGPSGLTGKMLKQILGWCREDLVRDLFLNGMARIVQAIMRGRVPLDIFGARLIALNKEDGGVRPIAVGSVLVRLAGKIATTGTKDVVNAQLSPIQFGVAVSNAVESVAKLIDIRIRAGYTVLSLDFQNAFNAVRRDALLIAA